MAVALQKPMSLADFLTWEEAQPARYEFDGFGPVAMTGGTLRHNRIMRRLHRCLDDRLAGKPCEPFGPDVKIVVAGKVRYPDALVTCSPQTGSSQVAEAPVVVFEFLRDSTSRTDRIEKVREYQATASIQRYVILEQDSVGATVFERQGDSWSAFTLAADGVLRMPEIDIEVALTDIYSGVVEPAESG